MKIIKCNQSFICMQKLKIKFLSKNAEELYNQGETLKYQTSGSSGFDIKAVSVLSPKTKQTLILGQDIDNYILQPMEIVCVQVGFSIGGVPENYEVQIRPRSGLAFKHGITIVNSPGTIDSDYRGEIGAILCNLSKEPFEIKKGERIAQMVVCPIAKCEIEIVEELDDTNRGSGRFGSTGV